MTPIFVAGAGTDIGKTFVTAGLLRRMRARSIAASALKPLASGFDSAHPADSDPAVLLRAMGIAVTAASLDAMSPFRFAAPLAPNLAARREGRSLDLAPIVEACRARIAQARGPLLIEGVGGVMSPIAEDATGLDLVRALGCPVLLVAGSYLGAISHALTAAAALASAGAALRAVVVNESVGGVDLGETAGELRRFLPGAPVVTLPRGAGADDACWDAILDACALC